jgi:hypothetical protein
VRYFGNALAVLLEGCFQFLIEDPEQCVSVEGFLSDPIVGVDVERPQSLGLAAIDALEERAIDFRLVSCVWGALVSGEGQFQRVHDIIILRNITPWARL